MELLRLRGMMLDPMNGGRSLRRASSGLWLPKPTRTRVAEHNPVRVFVPHDAVFPHHASDFEEFRQLVTGLSRTDALLWCARLNLHLGHPWIDTSEDVQKAFVAKFFGAEEVERLNAFVRVHGTEISVFSRAQLLELIRWIALWSHDHDDDGNTFRDPGVRQRFARAALIASEVWGRRLYRDDFAIRDSLDLTRRRVLAALREAHVATSDGPHPLLAIARGACIMEHLRNLAPEIDRELVRATGLALDEYFSVVMYVASQSFPNSVKQFIEVEKSGLLRTAQDASGQTRVHSVLEAYLGQYSQTPDELRASLWGTRDDATEEEAGPLNLNALRAKPLLRVANDRGIVIDPVVFLECAAVGPLFHLVHAFPGRANGWFGKFGDAFEDYFHELMARTFVAPEGLALVRRYVPNAMAWDQAGNCVEIADAILFDQEAAVIMEAKAVWLREDRSGSDTDPQRYLQHLREKYGASVDGAGERVKGLGQLARALRGLASGSHHLHDLDLSGVRRLVPVLVVHDVHVTAFVHGHILAAEFAALFGVDAVRSQWQSMRLGNLQVEQLIVLTVEDVEFLESVSTKVPIVQLLINYASSSKDRMLSFRDFLCLTHPNLLRFNSKLLTKAEEMLHHVEETLLHPTT
jgi:hypothetical protein